MGGGGAVGRLYTEGSRQQENESNYKDLWSTSRNGKQLTMTKGTVGIHLWALLQAAWLTCSTSDI